jgi:hypothetical protein
MRAFYKRFGDFDRDLGYTYGANGWDVPGGSRWFNYSRQRKLWKEALNTHYPF